MAFFDKIKSGLEKTRKSISSVVSFSSIDEDFYDGLEEALVLSDIGAQTAMELVDRLRARVKQEKLREGEQVKAALRELICRMLLTGDSSLKLETRPSVVLVVGVNGVGKTTTIGKMAAMLAKNGKKVLLCAGDTFRAAAADQLEIWAQRSGADIIRQAEGADPAAVVYDAISAAKARGADVIICDTAGRLHNKSNLMNELEKIGRIITRELPQADREVLMVLDAVTGQNGLAQAKQFARVTPLTGIVLTKLDGTAKGGIAVAIGQQLGIPVKLVGVGEGVDDLMVFDPEDFSRALI